MGFFDSKTISENESTYDNPELRQYTSAYRGAAPWGFAAMDPNAALFAMGGGTKLGGTDLGQGAKDYLKGLSDDEKKEKQQTDEALGRIKQRQESGQFLTSKETEFINTSLDKAFEFAHKTAIGDWTKATQMMAGSRGMRMSDTPVAEPAMKELRNLELGFGSERAKLQLATTMEMSQNNMNFDAAFAQFNKGLANDRSNMRAGHYFGGGLQAAGQLGFKTTERNVTTQKMSGFQQVMAGFSMATAGISLAGKVAAGAKAMSG